MTAVTGPLLAGAEIKVDGQALDPAVQAQVLEIRVDQHLRLPDRASVRLADPTPRARRQRHVRARRRLRGAARRRRTADEPVSLFDGQIGALEPEFTESEAILAVRALRPLAGPAPHEAHRHLPGDELRRHRRRPSPSATG